MDIEGPEPQATDIGTHGNTRRLTNAHAETRSQGRTDTRTQGQTDRRRRGRRSKTVCTYFIFGSSAERTGNLCACFVLFLNGFGLGARYRCTFGGGGRGGFLKFYGVLVWAQFAICRKCAQSQYFSFCVQVPAVYVRSEPSRGAYMGGEEGEIF